MGDAFVVVGALRMAIELLVKGWSFQVTQRVGIGQWGIKGAEKDGGWQGPSGGLRGE